MYMCTCKRSVLGSISTCTCTCVLVTIEECSRFHKLHVHVHVYLLLMRSLVGSICTYTCVLDNATEESSRFHSTCTCTFVLIT